MKRWIDGAGCGPLFLAKLLLKRLVETESRRSELTKPIEAPSGNRLRLQRIRGPVPGRLADGAQPAEH